MPELQELHPELLNQKGVHPNLTSKDGIIYQNRKILLSCYSPLEAILAEYHSTQTGGHAGISKTYSKVSSNFFERRSKLCEGFHC